MHSHPVALITGASRGIGRGIALALAQHGYAIAINYASNEAAARETQALLGAKVDSLLCQADIGLAADRAHLLDAVMTRWDRVDVLVNNAGITSVGRKDLLDATEESWDTVLAVNLKGPYFLTQQVALAMLARRAQLHEPVIVNISSVSAFALSLNRGDYCISKAGLAMLTQLFAARLAADAIRVYEVRPGIIDTDMTAGGRDHYSQLLSEGLAPLRRMGTAEDVGKAVASLVTGALPYCTGEVVRIDGGYHLRRFP